MSAVTKTGPLIVLAKLNRLHLLPALYGEVVVPQAVYQESVVVGQVRGYSDAGAIQSFLEDVGWHPVESPPVRSELMGDIRLGQGELEAIVLARQYQSLLLIDEVYARAIAEQIGLQTVGTLGILVEAHRRRNLPRDVLRELLIAIERREDIWIHPDLCRRVRRELLEE